MVSIGDMDIWIILMIIGQISGISFNRPKFCSNASWNSNATTFATNIIIGARPYEVFVDTNNTVYVANQQFNQVVIWAGGNATPTRIISGNILTPMSLFVTSSGDIYVDSDNLTGRVDKWTLNSTFGIPTMYTCQKCYDLFIDLSNTLYCSMKTLHRIVAMSLNSNSSTWLNVAGTGSSGNTPLELNGPYGIFVNTNYDLYVADSGNSRIQLFRSGEINGTTVAVNSSTNVTITLKNPTGITLDADGYLFIVDKGNSRILGSGPNGFRCLVGCNDTETTSTKLSSPYTFSFDNVGNMFVADTKNNRIQKFSLITTSCSNTTTTTTTQNTIISTTISNVFSTMTIQTNETGILPSKVISYNRLKFCPSISWNPNGITFATIDTIGTQPYGIFIDTNNTIYILDRLSGEIVIWFNNSTNPTRRIPSNYSQARGFFVSINGDIYVDNGYLTGRVEKYSLKTNSSSSVMYVGQQCFGLFIDANNTLYCSVTYFHQIATKSLNSDSSQIKIVAGTGCPGLASDQLNSPYGIFVDNNFDLYIADYNNSRIQLFRSGESNGTTVAGITSLNITITLYMPTGITLDLDNNLFIVDKSNNRIVVSGPNGFRCILGCNGIGSTPYQMSSPQSISFDTYGNMFITDWVNNRVQKFLIVTDACALSSIFVPPSCATKNQIGLNCNLSSTACDISIPCQNNGTCINSNSTAYGYTCTCPLGFNGDKCQTDNRPCQVNTCWNNGLCIETSNTTFECLCQSGYTNIHCETKINYCDNIKCLNNGICRSILLNFTCECLGTSYSGRYCQITSQAAAVHQVVSKSLGYVAIAAITTVVMFVIMMDVLKYVFGIDLTKTDLENIGRKKRRKNIKRRAVVQRFFYVETPPQPSSRSNEGNISIIEETTV